MGKVSELTRRPIASNPINDFLGDMYRGVAKHVDTDHQSQIAEGFKSAHDDLVKLFEAAQKRMRADLKAELTKDLNSAVEALPPAEHTVEKTTETVVKEKEVPRDPVAMTVKRGKSGRISEVTGNGVTYKVQRNKKGLLTGVRPIED